MRIFRKEEDLMFELKPEFQKKLFSQLLEKYGRLILSQKLGKNSSMIYHYKNNFVKALPKKTTEIAFELSNMPKEELNKNVIRCFSAKESIKQIMQLGMTKSHQKLKDNLSIKFRAYNLIIKRGNFICLDVLKWLNKNKWVEKLQKHTGLIKDVKLEGISHKKIRISYYVYNRKIKKYDFYSISIPRVLRFNEDLFYFLGLLYGDGLSGARIGIVNKDKLLINWTAEFLKTTFKDNIIKAQLFLYKEDKTLKVAELFKWIKGVSDEAEIYRYPAGKGSYVFNIFITSNILRRILDDFLINIESLFKKISFEMKGSFLAGFFDAEGNVNKLDRNLRFSQKIDIKVKTIQNILNNEGYHTRYDGSSILIGFKKEYRDDLDLFKKQILPFLKHSRKTIQAKELLDGNLMREEYNPILMIINQNPEITQKEISEKIRRIKSNAQLIALVNSSFVSRIRKRVDESFKYTITDKGLEYLEKK